MKIFLIAAAVFQVAVLALNLAIGSSAVAITAIACMASVTIVSAIVNWPSCA